MGVLAKVKNGIAGLVGKAFTLDRDHGGWIDTSWGWNYWQQNLSARTGINGVVYTCIQAYAKTIAQMPIRHKRKKPSGGMVQITNSSAAKVFRKLNNYQTRSDFLLNLVDSLLYDGNAYCIVERDARFEIVALHPISPYDITPYVVDGERFYHLAPNELANLGGAVLAPARDVLHIKLNVDETQLRGKSPILAAAPSIAANNAIKGHQANFFENMSRPSGILTSEEKLTTEQTQMMRDRWDEMTKGINSGKVPILSWGFKWQPLSLSSTDSQLIESLKLSTKDIAAIFGVPMQLIGENDGATYNNVHTLMMNWKAQSLGFYVNHIELALADLFRLVEPDEVELDMNELLRTDIQTRYDAYQKAVTASWLSPNEIRRMENLDEVEGGEMPLKQMQDVPLNQRPESEEQDPIPDEERAFELLDYDTRKTIYEAEISRAMLS